MLSPDDSLDWLVNDILFSNKYRDICPDLVRNIGARELAKRRTLKEAIKATRNKLHQVSGAYFVDREDYASWRDELARAVSTANNEQIKQVCRRIMAHHASTRERLPLLDQFYTTLLAHLPPISSVLDLACGLHPLAIPWMPLTDNVHYYACDIYRPLMNFLNEALALLRVQGYTLQCDIVQSCPDQQVDVAFLLKTIPCLEQLDKRAGQRLLYAINARHLIVSFPVHSLGGKSKGMAAYYEAHFRELIGDVAWEIKKIEFATELVFLIQK
jgi:16S rRNA (guanine(1405)-N(7))-methyltransferase